MKDYDKTPSFYKTDEVFQKYLGRTSYYVALQSAVSKIVSLSKPKEILELGTGTGATAHRLAEENPECIIVSIDVREEMVQTAISIASDKGINNVKFLKADMVEYVRNIQVLPELLILLYSFHHIMDPIEEKVGFLKTCLEKLPVGGRICIAETFLPGAKSEIMIEAETRRLWSSRIIEGYASTFWAALDGLSQDNISYAREIAVFSKNNELKAGELVVKRDDEFLVSMDWLCRTAIKTGFVVEIAEPCNSVGDGIVLILKK
ncbi:class I SAM-dependent methyltransferase [Phosphitispora fastidiosa]|uniref:class I SAM-dependent methyltransferase n=1 Tax=Phosphitispora fastidiosa TaxID=2837202 RepID=UPI001E42654E|nr:class I SAM-dependent methyltransferase [Phosphitispora fastidiosa]MBU7006858.1 ubiquinone/menaquinone biosynthesis C-methylase UbiE [Phosphitispora fastidiosa]